MSGFLGTIFGGRGSAHQPPRERWSIDHDGPIYAVGDVHGHLDLLRGIEARIFADGSQYQGGKLIIMLGDMIDRGPRSAQVLDHVLEPLPEGWRRICVAGNHEATMYRALSDVAVLRHWLTYGGLETLASYGVGHPQLKRALVSNHRAKDLIGAHVPAEHINFLESLPALVKVGPYWFCHAIPRSDLALEAHTDDDLLWHSDHSGEPVLHQSDMVVHGHVPVPEVEIKSNRINVDTGAYASRRLSSVRLMVSSQPKVIWFSHNEVNT